MSVVRIKREIKRFTYQGDEFGLRPPIMLESLEIAKKMSEYQRTVKSDVKQDVADGIFDQAQQFGDLSLMLEQQKYIAKTLVVDVTDPSIQVFREGGEDIDKVPMDFIGAAFACYMGASQRVFKGVDLVDVFGQEFVKANATVPEAVIQVELARLDATDKPAAHKARIALDLVKPGGESPDANPSKLEPSKAATTT